MRYRLFAFLLIGLSANCYSSEVEITLKKIKKVFLTESSFKTYSDNRSLIHHALQLKVHKNIITVRFREATLRKDTVEAICTYEYSFGINDTLIVTTDQTEVNFYASGYPLIRRDKIASKVICRIFSLPSNVKMPTKEIGRTSNFSIPTPSNEVSNKLYQLFKLLPNKY